MTSRSGRASTYLLHCVPGLERVVIDELHGVTGEARVLRTFERFDDQVSVLLVRSDAAPADLVQLRTVEDVFLLASEIEPIDSSWTGLKAVREALVSEGRLDAALNAVRAIRPARGRPSYRVVARMSGRQAFRRVDLQRTVERVLLERLRGWRVVDEGAQVELWVHLVGSVFLLGARLSDARMRHRIYLTASRRAALKPTIAAAMVALTGPMADDVFLDPMCGSGTIPIERAYAGRYRLLLAGDIDPDAVRATHENVGTRYKPIEIRVWDTRQLPLDAGSVTVVACNLPFGKQIGSSAENRSLYPAALKEWSRVLASQGRVALLTSERRLLQTCLRRFPRFSLRRTVPVLIRGQSAAIYVLEVA